MSLFSQKVPPGFNDIGLYWETQLEDLDTLTGKR
jgi:hypothetical protein